MARTSPKPPLSPHLRWDIPKDWEGETVVCIGSGPSLTTEQVRYTKGKAIVIAINNAGWLAPWADVLYFCDRKWFMWHNEEAWFQAFEGRIIKGSLDDRDCITDFGMKNVLLGGDYGYIERSDAICHGRNSGYAAVHLAARRGAKKIILIGYDMGFDEGKPSHWHGGHKTPAKPSNYKIMRARWPSLALEMPKDIDVVNCSIRTRIDCFRHGRLDSEL
jgi:hypothetical protein